MKRKRTLLLVMIAMIFLSLTNTETLHIKDLTSFFYEKILLDNREQTNELETDHVIISRVIDGDTVLVTTSEGEEERVRLLLIDTPESVSPREPVQKFGPEAAAFAKQRLKQGQTVTLEKGNPQRDQYGRLLGYLWINDENFNKSMIEKGYARVAYVFPPNTKYVDEFREAEHKAKDSGVGIWSIPGYVTENGFDMSVVNDME